MQTGQVGQYKVAYTMQGQNRTLYSSMAQTIDEARTIAAEQKGAGSSVVIMKNLGMDDSANGNYKWEVLKEYNGKGLIAAMIIRDPKFWIVAVLILVATFFLARSRTGIMMARS